MLVARFLGQDEAEHLQLVELMDPEDAPRVLPVGAGLPTETRGVADVPPGQCVRLEDLAHMERGERHLGRSDQVQVIFAGRVDLRLIGGEESRPVHGLLANQHRRDHR